MGGEGRTARLRPESRDIRPRTQTRMRLPKKKKKSTPEEGGTIPSQEPPVIDQKKNVPRKEMEGGRSVPRDVFRLSSRIL